MNIRSNIQTIARPLVAAALALVVAVSMTRPVLADGAASTRNIILGAAAVAAGIIISDNVHHKQAQANTIVGYTADGGTVYADGHIVWPDGSVTYANSSTYYYPAGSNVQYTGNPNGNYNGNGYYNNNGYYNANGNYNSNGYNGYQYGNTDRDNDDQYNGDRSGRYVRWNGRGNNNGR